MRKATAAPQPEFAKYIVLVWNGKEQVLVFPFNVKHADILEDIRKENPHVRAVSAGLYCNEPGVFWSGGQSASLSLRSRPEDQRLLQSLFNNPATPALGPHDNGRGSRDDREASKSPIVDQDICSQTSALTTIHIARCYSGYQLTGNSPRLATAPHPPPFPAGKPGQPAPTHGSPGASPPRVAPQPDATGLRK